MEITYLGHASFGLLFGKTLILTDPFDPKSVGFDSKKIKPDFITISHNHADHCYVADYPEVAIFDLPGEYEKNGVYVRGFASFHDGENGSQRGKNIIFKFEWEGKSILHLGDLGHMPSAELLEEIGAVDVLLLPIGGHFTMDLDLAIKLMNKMECNVCIPMHYRSDAHSETFAPLHTLEDFYKKLNLTPKDPQKSYKYQSSEESTDTQIVVLDRAEK